jgi:dienelactone hydrolase
MRTLALLLVFAGLQDGKAESGASACRSLRPSTDPELQKLLEKYEFKDKEFSWQLRPVKDHEKYSQHWLTFPSAVQGDIEENNTVWAKYWQPKDDQKKRPAALVLHWLGGSFDALDLVCRRLAEEGIAALMMYMPHYGPRKTKNADKSQALMNLDMDRTLANMRQAVLDARRAGDWLASRPDVEPSRVGLVGISLGAILGSLAAGVDDRFSRSVFLIGGGDLPAIIMSGSKETADQKRRLEEAGYTVEKLRELWKDVEPLTYAGRLRREDVLMINAESDEVIPRACTEKLHEAIGKPEIKWFKGGHYAIAFQLGPIVKDIVAHLSRKSSY